jgi:NAD(P)-dependent dehydrogenase (short-subunit alcohol dehydrogenase family)
MSSATVVAPVIAGCSGPDLIPASGVPRSHFNAASTAEQVTEGLNLGGRTAVVTGCNSGIGYETMRVLALRGAHVVGTGRTIEKANAACASVKGATTPVQLELTDFDSVAGCADSIRRLDTPLDIIVCNAGMYGGDHVLVNGVEKNFAVNHLGHFLLVNLLLDHLFLALQGRVVVVSSRAGYSGAPAAGILFDDLGMQMEYSASLAYGHSKLANALFSLELARRLADSPVTSNSLHPGVISTSIVRRESVLLRTGFRVLSMIAGKSIEEGAATSCYVASRPELGDTSGRYFEDCNAVTVVGNNHMHDAGQAERLWLVSEELTRNYLPHQQNRIYSK